MIESIISTIIHVFEHNPLIFLLAPKTFLLFSQKNTISRLVINNDDFDPDTPEVVLPIPQLKNIKALSYDPVKHFLYWIEGKNMVIKKAAANGTLVSSLSVKFITYP